MAVTDSTKSGGSTLTARPKASICTRCVCVRVAVAYLWHPVEHDDKYEIEIGEAVELLEKVDWQECEQRVLGSAYLIASVLMRFAACHVIGQYDSVSNGWFVNLAHSPHHILAITRS